MSCLFYTYDGDGSNLEVSPPVPGMTLEVWRPCLGSLTPPGLSDRTYAVWWMFHYVHVFRNRDYGVLLARVDGKVVHRAGLFPPYFRFPFMARDDLQIGDVWTAPEYRRRGIASCALRWAMATCARPGRRIWYVVEDTNDASIRTAEALGMRLVGTGERVHRFGSSVLGAYVITITTNPVVGSADE